MKVLWITPFRDPTPYDKSVHAEDVFKFLFWNCHEGGILIACSNIIETHKGLLWDSNIVPPHETPDGAGIILFGEPRRKVIDWTSEGFNVVTPKEFRQIILEALGVDDGCKR